MTSKTFPLNHNVTCVNYGIYVATCVICYQWHSAAKQWFHDLTQTTKKKNSMLANLQH